MLKRILILVMLLPLILNLTAQDTFEPSTHIGINAGNNFSRVSFTPKIKQDLLSSVSYGLVFRHISEPHIGLQFEINFVDKGWYEKTDSIGDYKRKLSTLDVPVMAAFIAGSRTVRFAFTLGPYVSYLRHEKETINIVDSLYQPYYLKPLVNNWEFGFTGGLGIELHTKIGAFGIRATYSHSLTNLFPLNVSEFYFNGSRNQVIHAGITYLIKL